MNTEHRLEGKKLFVAKQVGCTSSRINVDRYQNFILGFGASTADSPHAADIILVDTCAFSEDWEKASLKNITETQVQARENAKVIVCGCLPAMNEKKLKSSFQGDYFSPKSEKDLGRILGLDQEELQFFELERVRGSFLNPKLYGASSKRIQALFYFLIFCHRLNHRLSGMFDLHRLPLLGRLLDSSQLVNPHAYSLAVSQGCLGSCSFCVIPLSKGRTQSTSLGLILENIREKVAHGTRKIVLTSEDTGAYGKDIGVTVVDLLEHIQDIPGDFDLHLSFFDPRWLGVYENGLIATLKRGKIKYLQLPLQSASNSVLGRMRRCYQIEEVERILGRIREEVPRLTLQTQIIAGFPGETLEEHLETKAFLQKRWFHSSWIFEFCQREGAETEKMAGFVPAQVIKSRARELRMASGDYMEISKHG